MFEVIYLTGAPAAGKSSLTHALKAEVQPLTIFEYGERLTAYLREKYGADLDQEDLRTRSGTIASPEDIRAVDRLLLEWVAEARRDSHLIIDSHAVTKESYGFRVTAYRLHDFEALRPTQIWMLYTSPATAVERISRSPEGRPTISVAQAAFHTQLQASVAIAYGMQVGVPVYLIDAERPLSELTSYLGLRLRRDSTTSNQPRVSDEKA